MSDAQKPTRYIAIVRKGENISRTFVVEPSATVGDVFAMADQTAAGFEILSRCEEVTLRVDALTVPPPY